LGWLSKHFQGANLQSALAAAGVPAAEILKPIVKPTLLCLQDKSAEVRKPAELILSELLARLGYDTIRANMKDIKPAVVIQIQPIIDKLREALKNKKPEPAAAAPTPAPAPAAAPTPAATAQPAAVAAPAPKPVSAPVQKSQPTVAASTKAPASAVQVEAVPAKPTISVAISWLEVLNSSTADDNKIIDVMKAMNEKLTDEPSIVSHADR